MNSFVFSGNPFKVFYAIFNTKLVYVRRNKYFLVPNLSDWVERSSKKGDVTQCMRTPEQMK